MEKTVLVAEDDGLIRYDICSELSAGGFSVLEAMNSTEALSILDDRDDIHALFTDIEMPGGIDGLKLSKLVRDRWPSILIMIASGRPPSLLSNLPANIAFIEKPYIAEQVVIKLRESLNLQMPII